MRYKRRPRTTDVRSVAVTPTIDHGVPMGYVRLDGDSRVLFHHGAPEPVESWDDWRDRLGGLVSRWFTKAPSDGV